MNYILIGCLLGVSAAIMPGPLMALLIAQTIQGNWKNGVLVALSPLVSDLFVASFVLVMLAKIPDSIVRVISIIGGLVVIFYGIKTILGRDKETVPSGKGSLLRGVVLNISNPHPYIFWSVVAGPLVLKAYQINIVYSISFIAVFYIFFIGLASTLAYLVSKGKDIIHSKYYKYALIICGVFMISIGCYLVVSSLR